jgi:hypothetical protein
MAASHIFFREPEVDDWMSFAGEFWDHWEEGTTREQWAANAETLFQARFPEASLKYSSTVAWFVRYWNRQIQWAGGQPEPVLAAPAPPPAPATDRPTESPTDSSTDLTTNSPSSSKPSHKEATLFWREWNNWWDAFCAEVEEEGFSGKDLTHEALARFAFHFNKVLSKRLGLKPISEESAKSTASLLSDCLIYFNIDLSI